MLDVRKPLRRGIFVSTRESSKLWLAFKYDNLSLFCLGCGKMGHGVVDYDMLSQDNKAKWEDYFPNSIALPAESKLLGREFIQFQKNYTGPAK